MSTKAKHLLVSWMAALFYMALLSLIIPSIVICINTIKSGYFKSIQSQNNPHNKNCGRKNDDTKFLYSSQRISSILFPLLILSRRIFLKFTDKKHVQ